MIKKLHSLIVLRVSGISRAVSRSPSAAKCFPWLLAGAVRTRTISRPTSKRFEVFLGPQSNQSVSIDLSSQEEIDVFGEVLIDRNYPLERVPFEPDMVLDLGANIGFFSAAARMAFPRAPIQGWEPDARNHRRAVQHPIMADGRTVITQAAVSDRPGTLRMTGTGHGCAVVANESEGEEVSCADFPRWWNEHGRARTVCKIDIEGHEEILLPAMRGRWLHPCAIFLETHAERGCDGHLVAQLENDGFAVELLRSHSLPGDARVFKEYLALSRVSSPSHKNGENQP